MEIFHDFGHFGLRVEGNELFLLNFLLAVLMSERWFIWGILLLFGFDQGFYGAIQFDVLHFIMPYNDLLPKRTNETNSDRFICSVEKITVFEVGGKEWTGENIRIILMSYQINQEDECFVATELQDNAAQQIIQQHAAFTDEIRGSLPQANELKPYYRPTNMVARLMSTEPDIRALPNPLNQPCEQPILHPTFPSSRPKLNNKQKLGLAEYLGRRQFYVVYSKHASSLATKQSINEMTMRLRKINQVSDYDSKSFKQIGCYQPAQLEGQKTTQIDSNFECGNLARAYCNTQHEGTFYLLLEQDTNTHGYTNWFFFRVRNKEVGVKKFYVLNMVKSTAFYKQGMKISVFSMKKYEENRLKWHKSGSNISFFQTNFPREEHNDFFNSLYFEYQFEYEDDEVYFAVSQPYTYSRMTSFIQSLGPTQRVCFKMEIIGYSTSNNIIPSVNIYANDGQHQTKKTILFMARQHPCEMGGSFISEQLVSLCQSPNEQISFILSKFNVMVIPMVNPDGVIYGNSRSNLTGLDLNRHWGRDVIKQLTPETHRIRNVLAQLQKNRNHIKFLLDLHGHGKKLNSFLFCCKKQDRISNRYFPLIMSKIEPRFELVSCTYGIARDKENTVRAQLYDIGISDCYTLENSYYGYNIKESDAIHSYTQTDYKEIAKSIFKSLCVYFSNQRTEKDSVKQKLGWNLDNINEELVKIVDKLEKQEKKLVNDEDMLSESDPEGDGLKLEERLKMCTNNKILDRKIRDSFKKNRGSIEKPYKNSKKKGINQKNYKVKTQPVEQEKEDQFDQFQNTKILERKIENKLILSKKLRTQNKLKNSIKERKIIMQNKKIEEEDEAKLVKKMLNKPIHPFKTQNQTSRLTNTVYSQKNSSVVKSKPFERCKIYEKLKTQIQQNHSFSVIQIQKQHERKEKIEEELSKLKQENLKNVVKESLLFMDITTKNKKCRWVEDKRPKFMASNHLIQARLNSFSANIEDIDGLALKPQKSQSNFDKQKLVRPAYESIMLKTQSQPKKHRPKKSYQRFQSFIKNTSSINKLLREGKGPVFYHFPVM